jgi:ribosomal protein S18 acetylase RimI-like enzyme
MQTSSSISLNLNTYDTESFDILLNSNSSIKFRFLQTGDQLEVKSLCQDWFPIKYPDQWYDDIVQDKKYFALAACDTSTQRIIALIVANIYPLENCNREDQKILHKKFSLTTSVCYILILGVVKEYRRQGLASILLENLLNKLYKYETCKVIYLHVLYSNKQAIEFYQSKLFQYRIHLPYYYLIKGQHFDAYCFARYINGKIFFFFKFLIFLFRWLSIINFSRFFIEYMDIFNANKSLSIIEYNEIFCNE